MIAKTVTRRITEILRSISVEFLIAQTMIFKKYVEILSL